VGVPDSIAGELPIVVLETDLSELGISASELQKAARQTLGPAFVPSQFLTLKVLGLEAYPTTMWSKLLGIPPEELDVNGSLAELADSLTTMRFQNALRKET